jgi:DNA-binding MarR family transcriptional regulator
MTTHANEPGATLERLFHEPSRLAILSALCAAREGIPFPDLRDACGLTDGNLNRHLKSLETAGVVRIRKAFVNDRPRTTIAVTPPGLVRFNLYLENLSAVLRAARRAAAGEHAALHAPRPARARA